MSVILTSASEKALREQMYKSIKEELERIRSGNCSAKRILMIVPAQSTLLTEEEGFKALGGDGFSDFLVMSGAKLRSDVLREVGSPDRTPVNTLGRSMILRYIAAEHGRELSAFRDVYKKDGFIDMAADFIVQLKQNRIDPEALASLSEQTGEGSLLSEKLADMQLIFSEYEAFLSGSFTDSEDLLEYTAERLADSVYLKESVIWYCDFYSFTAREYEFIKQLAACCAGFNIALLSDPDRFACGNKTAEKLSALTGIKTVNVPAGDETPAKLRIINCASPHTQSRTVACDILSKLREDAADSSDFMVLTQDPEGMGLSLRRVFSQLGIPVFMDEKRSMQHSLCAEIVSDCLDICASGFRRDAVLSLIKSGVLGFSKVLAEDLEVYVKQYKIYDRAFLAPFKYGRDKLGSEKFDALENARSVLADVLQPFVSEFNNAGTVREKSECLYLFLCDSLKLPGFLKDAARLLEQAAFQDSASELVQSWDYMISLLDQTVELIGDKAISAEDYAELLVSCFGDVKIGVLPQSEGKIHIGGLTRTAFGRVGTLYIAGFNDGLIPSDPEANTLLTDKELSDLADMGAVLSKSTDTLASEELFQIWRALSADCDELVLLVCASDQNGEGLRPSPLLADVAAGHPGYTVSEDVEQSEDLIEYFQNADAVLSKLPQKIKELVLGEDVSDLWKAGYNCLLGDGRLAACGEAAFFAPGEAPVGPELSDRLFIEGKGYLSPSELENFAACPFKHFVRYGLKPEEAEEFSVSGAEAGTVYHDVIEKISGALTRPCTEKGIRITDPGSPWMSITNEELETLTKEIIENNSDELLGGLLSFDGTAAYKADRIKKVCLVFAKYMVGQVRRGNIESMRFEAGFGAGRELPPLSVETSLGTVRIEGKIDRVDVLSSGEDKYVKVIDYKSGTREFKKSRIDAGLELQLMIYLEGALGGGGGLKPAGVFYYAVKDPDVKKDFISFAADSISDDLSDKIADAYKLDGILVDNKDIIASVDAEMADDFDNTDVIRSPKKRLMSETELDAFRAAFRDTLGGLCERVAQGDIAVDPAYFNRQNDACRYCDYSSVCIRSVLYK